MKTTTWPLNTNIQALFLPSQEHFGEIENAKALDRYAVKYHNQHHRDYHLVRLQEQHQREGAITLQIFTSMYGFQVRNTNNFGNQHYLRRGATAEEALRFCKEFYKKSPKNCGVVIGHISSDFKPKFDSALEALTMSKRAPRQGHTWTHDEWLMLKKLLANNTPIYEIAKKHGRTALAIAFAIGKMKRADQALELEKTRAGKITNISDSGMIINGRNYNLLLNKAKQLIRLKVELMVGLPGGVK